MARLPKRAPLVNYNVNKAIDNFLLGDGRWILCRQSRG